MNIILDFDGRFVQKSFILYTVIDFGAPTWRWYNHLNATIFLSEKSMITYKIYMKMQLVVCTWYLYGISARSRDL